MSNSNWKDLPDWKNPADYQFLMDRSREVWAWEFLRRDPNYRQDFLKVSQFKAKHGPEWRKQPEAKVFDPPKPDKQTEHDWALQNMMAGIPAKEIMLDEATASKWELTELYDPRQPLEQGVVFAPRKFPRQIFLRDELLDVIDDEPEPEDELGSGIQRVMDNLAIVAFDMTLPVGPQIEACKPLLIEWQKKMTEHQRVQKAEGHAGKNQKWLRHLRSLDARRCDPPAKYYEIGMALGGPACQMKHKDELERVGDGFLKSAKSTVKDYRKILMFAGDTKIRM